MSYLQRTKDINGGSLTLVGVPIGNKDDFSPRAIDILKNSDLILCEDTRTSSLMLAPFDIHVPLRAYHLFNEGDKADEFVNLVNSGKRIALITDAGMPGISDPGYLIAHKCIEEKLPVTCIPGPNAALTALVASGLPTEHFIFYGFLDHRTSVKKKELLSLVDMPYTLIFHETAEFLKDSLEAMLEIMGDREACLARELTKTYEEFRRGTLSEILGMGDAKGEMILMVMGKKKDDDLLTLSIYDHYKHYVDMGYDKKEAMKIVASERSIAKNDVYQEVEKNKNK